MAILSIRIIGDPVLRTDAEPVTDFGPELRKLVQDMTETMEDVNGAGLAAPQVGIGKRVFTYRIGGEGGHIINPVLENCDDLQPDGVEGCLSVPGLGFRVARYRWTRATGLDEYGQPVVVEGEDLLARCLQHETDHLNGSLYVDRLAGEDRRMALRAIRNARYGSVTAKTTAERARTVGSSFGDLAGPGLRASTGPGLGGSAGPGLGGSAGSGLRASAGPGLGGGAGSASGGSAAGVGSFGAGA